MQQTLTCYLNEVLMKSPHLQILICSFIFISALNGMQREQVSNKQKAEKYLQALLNAQKEAKAVIASAPPRARTNAASAGGGCSAALTYGLYQGTREDLERKIDEFFAKNEIENVIAELEKYWLLNFVDPINHLSIPYQNYIQFQHPEAFFHNVSKNVSTELKKEVIALYIISHFSSLIKELPTATPPGSPGYLGLFSAKPQPFSYLRYRGWTESDLQSLLTPSQSHEQKTYVNSHFKIFTINIFGTSWCGKCGQFSKVS